MTSSKAIAFDFKPYCEGWDEGSSLHSFLPSTAKACGKIILVGEHAVVHGSHAVSIPFENMFLELSLDRIQKTQDLKQSTKSQGPHIQNLRNILQDALELLNIKTTQLKIQGHFHCLFGAGLGASAALCVCILRALSQSFSLDLSPLEIASYANHLERRFHGTPSGLDATTVALEKALLFKKGAEPQEVPVSPLLVENKEHPWTFAVIDSETRSPTFAMVQQTAPYFEGSKGRELLRSFDKAALQTYTALQNGNLAKLQEAFQKSDTLLKELQLVPKPLEDLMEKAQNCGVLASKITGAGGGGCVLCLLDPKTVDSTYKALEESFGAKKVFKAVLRSS